MATHIGTRGLTVVVVVLLSGLPLLGSSPARGAEGVVQIGSLLITSGAATGTISGFAPGQQVDVNGYGYVADGNGTVTLTTASLNGRDSVTVAFTGADGVARTLSAPLTDARTGTPLSSAQLGDLVPNTTAPASLSFGGGGAGGSGGTSGTGGTGSTGSTGSGSQPAGATVLSSGATSIPASRVTGTTRLVVSGVRFTPSLIRSRRPFTVRFQVTDTRGFVVRNALVYMVGVPANRITTPKEAATGADGTIAFRVQPTKLLPLKKGALLTIFVRARKPGEPVLGGASTRRLVSLRLSSPR